VKGASRVSLDTGTLSNDKHQARFLPAFVNTTDSTLAGAGSVDILNVLTPAPFSSFSMT
jgi:hypothetical protein